MKIITSPTAATVTEHIASSILCPLCAGKPQQLIFTKHDYDLVRCGSCKLAYLGNPPSASELRKLYSFNSNYQNDFTDETSKTVKSHTRMARMLFAELSRYRTQGRLLDVGCSAGFFLKQALAHGWESHGLEYSEDTAAVAAQQSGLHIKSGLLHQADYESQYFDVVTLWDVIEHVPDPVKTLQEVHSVLNDNGLIAISTPDIEGLFPKLSYQVAKLLGYWPHPEPPYHLLQFSRKTMEWLLNRAGFEIIYTTTKRIPLAYSFDLANLRHRSPTLWLYTAVFLPMAVIGPWIGSGDNMIVFAKKIA